MEGGGGNRDQQLQKFCCQGKKRRGGGVSNSRNFMLMKRDVGRLFLLAPYSTGSNSSEPSSPYMASKVLLDL